MNIMATWFLRRSAAEVGGHHVREVVRLVLDTMRVRDGAVLLFATSSFDRCI